MSCTSSISPDWKLVIQVLALAMCAVAAEAFAPSFMGQGLALRQAKASSALSMKIELAPLPYDYTALEPKIGKQTLEVHVACVKSSEPKFCERLPRFVAARAPV